MKNIFSFITVLLFAMILTTTGMELTTSLFVATAITLAVHVINKFIPNNVTSVLICGKISANIEYDCDTPLQAGVRERAIIFNYDDIVGATASLTNAMVITALTRATGKVGYVVSGRRNTINGVTTFLPDSELFDQAVTMQGFDISPATKLNVQGMARGRYIIILENIHKGTAGDSAFEIYGMDSGLRLMELTRDAGSAETQGAFQFNFMTDDISKEPKLPRTFYDTDYATTLAKVEALLVP